MERILTAIDFSDNTEAVLQKTLELVKAFDARLCIIHALPDGETYAREEDEEEYRREQRHEIDKVRSQFQEHNIFPHFKEASGWPAKCILAECERYKPDLLILGSHRHSKIVHMLGMHIREEMLKKAPCPVLFVHPDDVKER